MNPPRSTDERCSWNPEELDRFVSGECDRAEALDIERHVASCAACSAFVEDRKRVRSALRSAVAFDDCPPPELLGRVRDRLRESEARSARRPTWQLYAMAAGIVFAATGAGAAAWLATGNELNAAPVNRTAIRLMADAEHHGKCVGEMAGRMPPAPVVSVPRDPEVLGIEDIVREQSIGGMTITDSHRCTDGQRRFVHVIIELEGALAGVLVSDLGDVQAGGADGLPVVATAHTSTFVSGSKAVSVVSNCPDIDASVLAERLKPPMAERFMAAVRVIHKVALV